MRQSFVDVLSSKLLSSNVCSTLPSFGRESQKVFGPGGNKAFSTALVPFCIELCHRCSGQDKHEDVFFQEAML